jgi:hypothetical protein
MYVLFSNLLILSTNRVCTDNYVSHLRAVYPQHLNSYLAFVESVLDGMYLSEFRNVPTGHLTGSAASSTCSKFAPRSICGVVYVSQFRNAESGAQQPYLYLNVVQSH